MEFRNPAQLAVVLLCMWTSTAASAQPNAQHFTVLVHNSARVAPSVLRQSEFEAHRIFRAAGINVDWIECSYGATDQSVCTNVANSLTFNLRIVDNGKTQSDSVFGEAFLGADGTGRYCDVFVNRIEDTTQSLGLNPSRLLGTVAAHELGHLLLGSRAHSSSGLMNPVWTPQNLQKVYTGTLLFSPEQSRLIKKQLSRWMVEDALTIKAANQ